MSFFLFPGNAGVITITNFWTLYGTEQTAYVLEEPLLTIPNSTTVTLTTAAASATRLAAHNDKVPQAQYHNATAHRAGSCSSPLAASVSPHRVHQFA